LVVGQAVTDNVRRRDNALLDAGEGDLPKQSVVVVSQISSLERWIQRCCP
jgi:mRNA interferase MazF